jgi:hypothetical protein
MCFILLSISCGIAGLTVSAFRFLELVTVLSITDAGASVRPSSTASTLCREGG